MAKTNKRLKIFLIVVLILSFLAVSIFGTFLGVSISRKNQINTVDFTKVMGSANKTILFVGDGMGENHIKVTSSYYGKEMFMTSLAVSGKVSTFSRDMIYPTDSAAAASALATGKKYNNKEVSHHAGKDVESISEFAKSKGYGVGIVTTDNLYGATPAGFSSHANNRGDTDVIISGQINSEIDLFLGAGASKYSEYKTQIEEKGFVFSSDLASITFDSGRVFGAFSKVVSTDGTTITPTLKMLTEFAVGYMEENFPDGYFLMIEGAHIDKKSHDNKIFEMMEYLDNFDQSIKAAYDKIKEQTGTAIVVTADHETGDLQFNSDKSKINNSLYRRTGHSGNNVPYYMWFNLSKSLDIGSLLPKKIDNTDIYKLCKSLLNR